jgi:hypothetical protein
MPWEVRSTFAGADPRSKNQVSPGLKHVPKPDLTYSTGPGPNYQLTAADFPLSRLAIPGTRGALDPATDSNDAVSSMGIRSPLPGAWCRFRYRFSVWISHHPRLLAGDASPMVMTVNGLLRN